jgi:hypothetical protein
MGVPVDVPMTDEEAANFKAEFERAMAEADGRFGRQLRWLPPAPVLTPETARALLAECVTVVQPGEALVIRVPDGMTPNQVREVQEYADVWTAHNAEHVKVLFLPGEGFAVQRAAAAGES